jgi:HrpA-like RNA helicase
MPPPTLLVKGSLILSDEKKMAKANRDLPINYIMAFIKNRMYEYGHTGADLKDRIIIIRAETGSGKSTVLPVEVFRILRNKTTPLSQKYIGKNIICTQPRILTAIALANDVSGRDWNPDIILGKTVGYQTGPSSNKPNAGLIFATAGVLLVQLENLSDDEIMTIYKFILVDEAHERSQDCDLLLMYLKNFYIRNRGNKDLPFLILTSATFDVHLYTKYFNIELENTIEITGRAHPIYEHWPTKDISDYIVGSIETAIKIHEENHDDENDKCDILIFTPGIKQIELIKEGLEKKNKTYCHQDSKYSPFLILTINRDNIILQSDDFNIMFIKPKFLPKVENKTVKRRIIIATIVAETGLTVDTLKYVIDCGWNKCEEVYQPYDFSGLLTKPAPRSKIQQRKGRAGRLFPGHFYPLYTKNTYELLNVQQFSDFINSGIKKKFLSIVKEQQKQKILMRQFSEFRIEDITLLEPPQIESFITSNTTANFLGFISENAPLPKQWPPNFSNENLFGFDEGYGLTKLGYIASNINSISIESIKMILLSFVYNIAIEDMINIASIMNVGNLFNIKDRKKYILYDIDCVCNSIPNCYKIYNILTNLEHSTIGGKNKKHKHTQKKTMELKNSFIDGVEDKNKEIKLLTLKLLFSDHFIESLLVFEYFIDNIQNIDTDNFSGGGPYDDFSGGAYDDNNSAFDPYGIYLHGGATTTHIPKINSTRQWCEDNGLEYTNLIESLTKRNEIIEELYSVGIDPYKNESFKLKTLLNDAKNKDDIILIVNTIKNIKQCIYGGYYNNLLKLNPEDNSYYNNQNIKIKLSEPFIKSATLANNNLTEYKAKWILTNAIKFEQIKSPNPATPDPLLYTLQANKISILDGFIYPNFELLKPKCKM